MGLFDGQIKKFAGNMISALEEQANERLRNPPTHGLTQQGSAIIALTLIDLAKVLGKVALGAETTDTPT